MGGKMLQALLTDYGVLLAFHQTLVIGQIDRFPRAVDIYVVCPGLINLTRYMNEIVGPVTLWTCDL